jgi:hypothetical protein
METHDKDGTPPTAPPRYTGADEAGPEPRTGMTAGRRARVAVIAVVVIALLAVMLILHLTGAVGPGSNG